ncbi:hypothetical protein K1Y79_08415 [Chitinophaga sp. B61]|uniref:Uncharacterized protein n=2 Tax=Chitinophaga rhizophila TaxID=2866212 RepID=A0ABS7G9M2_9BACT|nr:hypothetical protein [Chitinophaga rhizophila]
MYLLPLLLSAILSLKTFRHRWPKPYKLFAVLVIMSFLTEVLANLWIHKLHNIAGWNYSRNNLWIYNFFFLVRFALLSTIFYQILNDSRIRKIIYMGAIVLLLFGLTDYFVIQGPFQYNTFSVIACHVSLIVLCLCYFKQLLQAPGIIDLHKEPMVWMTLGTFLYQSASLPFLIMFGFLNLQHSPLALSLLFINDIFNFLICTCYLISFLCKPQHSQPL